MIMLIRRLYANDKNVYFDALLFFPYIKDKLIIEVTVKVKKKNISVDRHTQNK